MRVTIFSKYLTFGDTKLLVWEGIIFSFAEKKSVKCISNDFFNWFKFVSDWLDISVPKKTSF